MGEQKKMGNPFEEENFIGSGGLWDGKVVTILRAKAIVDRLAYKDGSPVLGADGTQAVRNCVEIFGIADDQEFERRETYSVGALLPTADGNGFVKPDGSPFNGFHKNSEMAKFCRGLQQGGFPMGKLWDAASEKATFDGLVGAQVVMHGEAKHDKNGNIKKNAKGYEEQKFFPVEFKGFKTGVAATPVAAVTDTTALVYKANDAVMTALTELGGKATRAELVRKLSAMLVNDKVDGNKIVAMVARAEFHKDKPWTVDGTGYSL